MTRNYRRIKEASGKRQSNIMSVSTTEQQQQNGRRMGTFINTQRRSAVMPQISSPHGAEYRPQKWLPPNGLASRQNILLRNRSAMIEHNAKQVHVKSTKKPKSSKNRSLNYLCCTVDNGSFDNRSQVQLASKVAIGTERYVDKILTIFIFK